VPGFYISAFFIYLFRIIHNFTCNYVSKYNVILLAMEILDKSIGSEGRQTVVGVGPHTIKAGFKAFGCSVRVDDTQIKSWTDQKGTVVANDSNENIALTTGEYIPFNPPIAIITLNAASDSVALWLQPIK
jgi:hypothetical protein